MNLKFISINTVHWTWIVFLVLGFLGEMKVSPILVYIWWGGGSKFSLSWDYCFLEHPYQSTAQLSYIALKFFSGNFQGRVDSARGSSLLSYLYHVPLKTQWMGAPLSVMWPSRINDPEREGKDWDIFLPSIKISVGCPPINLWLCTFSTSGENWAGCTFS